MEQSLGKLSRELKVVDFPMFFIKIIFVDYNPTMKTGNPTKPQHKYR